MSVTIYTTPTCAFCKQIKAYLTEKGVEYIERDVAADTKAAQEMVDISHQMGVPVTVINNDDSTEPIVIIGFDQASLDGALNLS